MPWDAADLPWVKVNAKATVEGVAHSVALAIIAEHMAREKAARAPGPAALGVIHLASTLDMKRLCAAMKRTRS